MLLNTSAFDSHAADRGWTTNRQAAAALGVDHTVLHRIRRHEVTPSLPVLHRIATGLGVPHADLIEEES